MRLANACVLTSLTVLLYAASGCEDTDGDADGGGRRDGGTQDAASRDDIGLPPSGLATFRLANESAQVEFTTGDEEFLVIPYSVSDVAADAIDFTITVSGQRSTQSQRRSASTRNLRRPFRLRKPELWARWQARLSVERWTRALAERAARTPLRPRPAGLRSTQSSHTCSGCQADQVCDQGSCTNSLTIKTATFSSTASITASVQRKGSVAAILVDDSATVNSGDLDQLLATFENTIHPRDVALFGDPQLSDGKATRSSDRNEDGLVWIVLTPKVAEKQAVGFFVATDFTDGSDSNQADILYAIPPDNATSVSQLYPVLAHEFQHLLSYAQGVYRRQVAGGQGTLQALWLDEGLSHFAEDACGFGGENVTLLDEQLFPNFGDTRLFESDSANDGLAMRAMAMTFVRYLFERRGGASYPASGEIVDQGGVGWLQALLLADDRGTAGVTSTFGEYRAAMDFWVATIALDGRQPPVTDYAGFRFQPLVNDPSTGRSVGLVIRGQATDASGATVTLKGPLEEDIEGETTDETIPNGSAKFFQLNGYSGSVSVSVTSGENDFRFVVVRLK